MRDEAKIALPLGSLPTPSPPCVMLVICGVLIIHITQAVSKRMLNTVSRVTQVSTLHAMTCGDEAYLVRETR